MEKKILLVAPDPDYGYFSKDFPAFLKMKAFVTPLPIATIAALTPDDFEVDLWDEVVHGQIDDSTDFPDYVLVGITGFESHIPRAKQIAQMFRKRGIPVCIGGPGVSSAPQFCRDDFDILFIGEAELTWPQFIADFLADSYKNEYRQVAKPDLAISPIPRWDGLEENMKDYLMGAVQTSRGCPFDCEFCDVIYLFGRAARNKPIDKVLEEICSLQRLGMNAIFFCDDSFACHPRYTKSLLREIIALNRTFEKPLSFQTQLTITVAKDEEMLELLADVNFSSLFIGIETPNKESLKETNKLQNYRTDLVEDCKKIMSYGLPIRSGVIVGFDHDTTKIFEQQFEFLQETSIPTAQISLLKAPMGTRLWTRLQKEKRIIANVDIFAGHTRAATNIIPKIMTRVELLSGFCSLLKSVQDWDSFATRVKNFISGITRRPNVSQSITPDEDARQNLRNFVLSMDVKAKQAISSILTYTREHAPFMLKRILGLILQQYREIIVAGQMIEKVHKQIELETSGAFMLEIDQTNIFIPESFEDFYKEIFPEIHKKVYLELKDRTRTDEALIRIFADFLIRWGQTSEQFEDYHKSFLFEIADRTIAKENSVCQAVVEEQSEEEIPNIKKSRLAYEILKVVEQELRIVQL